MSEFLDCCKCNISNNICNIIGLEVLKTYLQSTVRSVSH